MTGFLLQLGLMSVQATIIIGVVLLIRFIFSKLHIAKKYAILLWIIPYIAMVLPWGVKTPFSFWQITNESRIKFEQAVNTMPYSSERLVKADIDQELLDAMEDNRWAPPSLDKVQSGNYEAADKSDNTDFSDMLEKIENDNPAVEKSGFWDNLTVWDVFVGATFMIWLLGLIGFLVYGIVSSLKLKKKLVCSLKLSENIYVADDIKEPFVFGVISPKIYLPCNLTKDNEYYVVEHEKTHIQRKDPLKKVAAFLITGIHWFNPFAYVAFHMMTKDMEMACDEETIQRIGFDLRQDYATALLKLSTKKRNMLIPVAFGEGDVKSRISNVIKYKKTLKILSVAAAVVILVVAAVFLTKPIEKTVALDELKNHDVVVLPKDDNPRNILVTYQGKEYTFDESYYDTFRIFLEELEIYAEEVNKSRAEDRPADVVIRLEGGAAYNFDKDLETMWCDNGVKPSMTYELVEPKLAIQFFAAQIGAYEAGKFEDEISDEIDELILQFPGYIADVSNYCGENGPFLDYADENYVIFHTLDRFFVYDIKIQEVSIGIMFNHIYKIEVDAEKLMAYVHDVEGDMITIYDCDIVNRVCGTQGLMDVDAFDDLLITGDYVVHDPTVFRSKECVQVSDGSYLYLESGSGLLEDLSIIQEDLSGKRTIYEVFDAATFRDAANAKIQLFNAACYMELVDLTHDGKKEYLIIELEDILEDNQKEAYLKVADEKGEILWQSGLGLPRAGWNSYYLVWTKEGACLLQYLPVVMQERGEYTYRLFYLSEDGSEVEVAADSVSFFIYPRTVDTLTEKAIPKDEMTQFAEEVNVYFENARLLISTVDGILKYQTPSKTYTYKELYQNALEAEDIQASESIELNITKLQNKYEKTKEALLSNQVQIKQ